MNPSTESLRQALEGARTIAVVGLSDRPERDSNEVARYLQGQGYRVIPVNPRLRDVLGERAYPDLAAIPSERKVDIVDVFRRSEELPPIMEEAITRKVPWVWMQLGVSHSGAAERGRAAGLSVVEDLCIMTVHRRLGIRPVGVAP